MDTTGAASLRNCRRHRLRRRTSLEMKCQATSGQGKRILLSTASRSTFALAVSMICASAWFVSMGVCSTGVTALLIQSAQESLVVFNRDHQLLEHSIEELKMGTAAAKQELYLSQSSCLLERTTHFEIFQSPTGGGMLNEVDLDLDFD
ncbi:expressed unknown protein [Seminavis robusta]|uniref:Uncharacterized protein n=1 Tax=Seminavis robusta TaxID=568900 RepID=A0A9N8EJD7_9STRA|nr:expressed unknown protein [Seminavis robusta]|eukprot:Sro1081_g239061.1  (148) ;mRNA; f:13606-14049